MNEVLAKKRTATNAYDDLTLALGSIDALLDIIGECDKEQADVNGAAFAIQHIVKEAKQHAEELYDTANGDES